jgi:hypothetical protein
MLALCFLYIDINYITDTVGPADVGLKEEHSDDDRGHGFFGLTELNRVARWAQPISYLDIYECDSFTVISSIFIIF